MTAPTSDPRWVILRAQSGDRQALEQVLLETSRQVGSLVRRIARDDADDVLQGVLWTVARKLTWLEDPAAFKPWVYRIATRAALKHVTRERRLWPFGAREELDLVPQPEAAAPTFRPDEIPALLSHATARSRAVIVLHYLEELSLAEIAVVMGVPLGTVKSRLSYGLRSMRQALAAQGRDG